MSYCFRGLVVGSRPREHHNQNRRVQQYYKTISFRGQAYEEISDWVVCMSSKSSKYVTRTDEGGEEEDASHKYNTTNHSS